MNADAILFDIGNVLLKFDFLPAARKLMEKNGLTEPPDREQVIAIKNRYEGGLLSRTEFLREVRPHFRDEGPEEEFIRIWADIFEPNAPMVALVEQLHGKLPLYLLSNIGCIHREFIFGNYTFFRRFDGGVYSYEEAVSKPSPEIYQRAIRRFGLDPARTIYIDDLPANIEAGEQAGFVALPYDFNRHGEFEARFSQRLGPRQPEG